MKIVIAGLGGIGGIVGGRLAAGLKDSLNDNVIFWCRGKTREAVLEAGLQLISEEGDVNVKPSLVTYDADEIGSADLVIFAVKTYQLEEAARQIAPICGSDTLILPLLNGVSASIILQDILPKSDVLGGCIYVSSHVERPGVIRQFGKAHKIFFGKPGGADHEAVNRYKKIEELLRGNGLNAKYTDSITQELWTKFIFLSPFAGVTTMYNRTLGEVLNDGESFNTALKMIDELVSLAAAKHIALLDNIVDFTLDRARSFLPATKTSMQLDMERGNSTELESIVGYVCREAAKLGVSVPVYDEVYSKLQKICKV